MNETLHPATVDLKPWREYLADFRKMAPPNTPRDDVKGAARSSYDYLRRCIHYRSETYQVAVDKTPEHGFGDEFIIWHLSFKRNDREAFHDWRVAQWLKNTICGPECEGIEIYPAESRLVDTSNQYHLWVFMNYTLPIGWMNRMVFDDSGPQRLRDFAPNAKQRPLP